MKRMKQRLGIYTVLLFLLTAAAVVLRTVALFYGFNFKTGYFEDKLLIGISDALTLVGVLLSLSYVAIRSHEPLRASFSSPAFYLPSGLVGVGLLFFSAGFFKSAFERISENSHLGFKVFSAELILELVIAILALVSIGYFILGALIEGRLSQMRAAFGIAVAVLFALYVAKLYFDTTLPINAPTKILDEMAYVFAATFFLFEIRISLGRDKWGAYIAFGMATAILTATASIPALILYFSRGTVLAASSLSSSVLLAALFVFSLSRVLHALTLRADRQCPLAAVSEIMSEEKHSADDASDEDEDSDREPDNYTMTFDESEGK